MTIAYKVVLVVRDTDDGDQFDVSVFQANNEIFAATTPNLDEATKMAGLAIRADFGWPINTVPRRAKP